MTYDPDVEDLAEGFIDDPPSKHSRVLKVFSLGELDALRHRLAQHIQDAIEDWFDALEDEIELRGGKPATSQGPLAHTAPTETPGAHPTRGTSDGNPDDHG